MIYIHAHTHKVQWDRHCCSHLLSEAHSYSHCQSSRYLPELNVLFNMVFKKKKKQTKRQTGAALLSNSIQISSTQQEVCGSAVEIVHVLLGCEQTEVPSRDIQMCTQEVKSLRVLHAERLSVILTAASLHWRKKKTKQRCHLRVCADLLWLNLVQGWANRGLEAMCGLFSVFNLAPQNWKKNLDYVQSKSWNRCILSIFGWKARAMSWESFQ